LTFLPLTRHQAETAEASAETAERSLLGSHAEASAESALLRSCAALTAALLRHHAESALTALLRSCAALTAALLTSHLRAGAETGRLCVCDAGCSKSSDEESKYCECKEFVHSSLLVLIVQTVFSCGFPTAVFKNAAFPSNQRPASIIFEYD
jgi:hypothetical protein